MYAKWCAMMNRCYNPKSHIFEYYGGRGIKVCDRWHGRIGFDNFVDDMGGFCPAGMLLERKENDKDYSPDNCVWSTAKEQAANRRTTKGQVRKPNGLRQRAIRAGLGYHLVVNRIKIGWSVKRALETPKLPRGRQRLSLTDRK
jgi:hypothetical protein